MAKKKPNKRSGLIVTTTLLVLLLMGAYYFYTSKTKQVNTRQEAFSTMYRIAHDLEDIDNSYSSIAFKATNSYAEKKEKLKFYFDEWKEFEEWYIETNDLSHSNGMEANKYKMALMIDSIHKSYPIYPLKNKQNHSFLKTSDLNPAIINDYFLFPIEFDSTLAVQDSIRCILDRIVEMEKIDDLNNLEGNYYYATKKSDFDKITSIHQIIRDNKEFDAVTLFNDSIAVFHSDIVFKNIKWNHHSIAKEQDKLDSLWLNNPNEAYTDISIGGTNYLAFLVPINGQAFKYAVGYIDEDKYAARNRGLDGNLINFIVFFVAMILLSMPLIRLTVTSAGEAYSNTNLSYLVIGGAGSIILICVVFISFGSYYELRHHVTSEGEHLSSLSDSIKGTFLSEMTNCLTQLDTLKKITDKLEKSTIGDDKARDSLRKQLNDYPQTHAFISSENTGECKVHSLERGLSYWSNIKKRDYFRNPDRFNFKNHQFGLESIYSYTTAKPFAVFSTRFNEKVFCLSTQLYSVNHTILPHGYSFCIVDDNGKVWFHNKPFNNLRENIVDELDQNAILKSSLKDRTQSVFKANYKKNQSQFYVSPIDKDLPLHLIVMYDLSEFKKINFFSNSVIVASMLSLLLIWTLGIFIYRLAFNRNTPYQTRLTFLLRFLPNPDLNSRYIALLSLHIKILLVVIITIVILSFLKSLYFLHLYTFFLLVGVSVIYWNFLLLRQQAPTFSKKSIRIFLFFILSVLLSPIVLFKEDYHVFSWSFFFLSIILIGINYAYSREKADINRQVDKQDTKLYLRNYISLIISAVSILILVPILSFYYMVSNEENTQHQLKQQRYFYEELAKKQDLLFEKSSKWVNSNSAYNNIDSFHNTMKWMELGNYTSFYHGLSIYDSIPNGKPLYTNQQYLKVFKSARSKALSLRESFSKSESGTIANFDNSFDGLYKYSLNDNEFKLRINKPIKKLKSSFDPPLAISIRDDHFIIPHHFFFGIILLLILIGMIVWQVLTKAGYFLFPYVKYSAKMKDIDKQRNLYQLLSDIHSHNNKDSAYIVTPFFSISHLANPELMELFKVAKTIGITEIYNSLFKEKLSGGNFDGDVVHIMFHNPKFASLDQLEIFVNNLDALQKRKGKGFINQIIYFSFILPRDFIDQIEDTFLNIGAGDEGNCHDEIRLLNLTARFRSIMGHLQTHYSSIMQQLPPAIKPKEQIDSHKAIDKYPSARTWLNYEIGDNSFLNSLDPSHLLHGLNEEDYVSTPIEMCERIYQSASNYYLKLWTSCTKLEKSVLFDIAEDSIVNMHKNGVVSELIDKGFIRMGPYLKLFNHSFTYFVLHQKEEVTAINEDLRKYGSGWSQYSIPLKIIAVAIVVFLVITKQSVLSDLNSVMISVGAILTFALRFMGNPFKSGSQN